MGYHHLDPNELAPLDDRPADVRSISDAAGLETLGVRRYVAESGQQIPLAYHYHDEQEEAFYVVSGTLHVETPDQECAVETDHLFVVDPGNPHRAFVPDDADAPVELLAIGAPSVDDVHEYEP